MHAEPVLIARSGVLTISASASIPGNVKLLLLGSRLSSAPLRRTPSTRRLERLQCIGMNSAARVVGSILRHDKRTNSYKLALIRSINDVVLSYPDLLQTGKNVVVPLRKLAEYWLAYYWPFTNLQNPIMQGPRSRRDGALRNDMSFRPALTTLRAAWEQSFGASRASDGFLLIAELRVPRIAATYAPEIQSGFDAALDAVERALRYPIQYAGPGGTQYAIFPPPQPVASWSNAIVVPGASPREPSVLIESSLWAAFQELSLWIEALCIHEWSLFTESLTLSAADRGDTYRLLTSRPDNRRPLTWERNQIELLMLEGETFVCPWTDKQLTPRKYAVDHIIPIAVYPTNELWNLVPSDHYFNSHTKRARMPTSARMAKAEAKLAHTYSIYLLSSALKDALRSDLKMRFALKETAEPEKVADTVARATLAIADARGVERF